MPNIIDIQILILIISAEVRYLALTEYSSKNYYNYNLLIFITEKRNCKTTALTAT